MDCAMDFVAFDFETANSRSDSACQLAVVRVRSGQIAEERCWLIRPPRLYFAPRHISIHGIRPEHVAQSPTMERIWPELLEFVDGHVLVAHNAGFDVGVLVSSLAAFDIACPHIEFSCTRAIARRTWPGRARYGLKPLGNWLGVEFRHHDALEDSRCCARIALAAAASIEAQNFTDLEKRLRLSRGRYSLGRVSGPRTIGGRTALPKLTSTAWPLTDTRESAPREERAPWHSEIDAAGVQATSPQPSEVQMVRVRLPSRGQLDPLAIIEAAAGSAPLARKRIVCLGNLRGLSAHETKQLVEALGGECQNQIASDTDYVIACGSTLLEDANQLIAQKKDAAEAQSATTQAAAVTARPIRLLSERQFLALIPGGKAAVRW